MFHTTTPPLRALAIGLLALLAAPLAAAQAEAVASFGKWQLLRHTLGTNGESRCDIRSRDLDSADDDTPPRLYLVGNGDPDRPFDIRLDTGGEALDPSRVGQATLMVDDKASRNAYANPLSSTQLSVTANIRELKLGGAVTVTVPLAAGGERRFIFSLIGFTAAYGQLTECNPPATVPSLAIGG